MMNLILSSLVIIAFGALSNGASKTALNRKALQNPNLYGGDMRGVDFSGFSKTRAAAEHTGPARLWPEGKVPYVIDDRLAKQTDLIESAMQEYHDKTCVKFELRRDEQDYLKIQLDDSFCNSYIGVNGGEQALNLLKSCAENKGLVMHELGHAIGFMHEHQRSDRDQFVTIIEDNIKDDMKDQFTKYNGPDNLLLVDFDYQSVMLYGPKSFSKDDQLETIKPSQDHQDQQILEVSDKTSLSERDVQAINKLYKCSDKGVNTGDSDGNNEDNTGDNRDNKGYY